jgi:hypothetical protein
VRQSPLFPNRASHDELRRRKLRVERGLDDGLKVSLFVAVWPRERHLLQRFAHYDRHVQSLSPLAVPLR